MQVLDASAVLEILLKTPLGVRHTGLLDRGTANHAPHLLDVEFAQVLRRLVHMKRIEETTAANAIGIFTGVAIARHPHAEHLPRIWELRTSISAYDATYVALAEALDAPLLTCDAKLSRAHGHHAKIILLQ